MICQKTFDQLFKILQMTHPFFPMFLIKNLQNVSNCALQWKMQFNPDPKKQAQEVIFSEKARSNSSLPILLDM